MRLREYENQATAQLAAAGADSPRLSVQAILAHVLGLTRLQCVLEAARPLTREEEGAAATLLSRRAKGEPLAYLLGHREFYSRDFAVTTDTLIPRPETELLVETALEHLPKIGPSFFADLGTGSGCIAVTLACERPDWRGLALDTSTAALRVAIRNAHTWQTEHRLAFIRAHMAAVPLPSGSCDLVASNPPYIADAETAEVMDEVLRYEPHQALFSPNAGLAHLQTAAREAKRLLRPEGLVLLEHGATQGAAVRHVLIRQGFVTVETRQDLAGLERLTLGRQK